MEDQPQECNLTSKKKNLAKFMNILNPYKNGAKNKDLVNKKSRGGEKLCHWWTKYELRAN